LLEVSDACFDATSLPSAINRVATPHNVICRFFFQPTTACTGANPLAITGGVGDSDSDRCFHFICVPAIPSISCAAYSIVKALGQGNLLEALLHEVNNLLAYGLFKGAYS
jgi:hypothetical protein